MRFLAFSLVFMSHLVPANYSPHTSARLVGNAGFAEGLRVVFNAIHYGGSFGVPVFFALSSYLITELLSREKSATETIHFRQFYLRRILRIWPLYFAALVPAFILAIGFPGFAHWGAGHFGIWQAVLYLLLSGNWVDVYGVHLTCGFAVLWSICVEEQFYLLWPMVLRFATPRVILAVCFFFWGTAQIATAIFAGLPSNVAWFNTLSQSQYFAIGAAISVFTHGKAIRVSAPFRIALSAAGVALFLAVHLRQDVATYLPYLTAGLGTTVIIIGFLGAPLQRWRHLRYLGKISYGLYVFHFVVLSIIGLTVNHLGHGGLILIALGLFVGLPTTILLAHLSYRYYETPFLRLKERYEIVHSRPV